MSKSMYVRSQRARDAALLLLALMLALAAYKAYTTWQKMDYYAKASAEQEAGRVLEAEDWYRQAEQITGFDYKNREIAAALEELRPVTELKRTMRSMLENVNAAAQVHDVPTLTKTYESYQALQKQYAGKEEAERKLLAETESAYPVGTRLTEAFTDAKEELMKSLDTAIAKKSFDNDTAVSYLTQIPAVFYKDERTKKQELAAKLKAYDQARLDTLFKNKPFEQVLAETAAIRKFYSTNEVQADWVLPLLDTYVQNTLAAQLKKNDLAAFIANAQLYLGNKELADAKSKASGYIQATMRSQFARAEQLAAARKFDEAVELYTALGAYKNTDKEIQALQQRRLESDPVQLLRKAAGDGNAKFTNVISAKSASGAAAYSAAGISDNQTIVWAQLGANQSISKTDIPVDRKVTVKSLQFSDSLSQRKLPVLLVETASASRKARYIAYEADGADLRKLLDVEADGFTQEKPGVLLIDNPLEERGAAAGQKATYEYQNGQYVFTKVKAELADILLTDLPKQKLGAAVRFQCSITAVEGATATVLLNGDVVLLTGSMKLKPGPAVITGTYTDKSRVMLGTPPQSATAYQVQVTAAAQ
ncbi:hypothetical protein [Paenibacillus rigui]|uniref:Uncharacterized protein n=1 Tax=Paenibacillus rigui TaxID=554312 RepID=A0A229UK17_9BACL|nr:hypothetical protein [Paenibacillus rigui]OXM83750.1 hypothetical protein CF651_24480 [Paenibacillus rigui]